MRGMRVKVVSWLELQSLIKWHPVFSPSTLAESHSHLTKHHLNTHNIFFMPEFIGQWCNCILKVSGKWADRMTNSHYLEYLHSHRWYMQLLFSTRWYRSSEPIQVWSTTDSTNFITHTIPAHPCINQSRYFEHLQPQSRYNLNSDQYFLVPLNCPSQNFAQEKGWGRGSCN